MTDLNIDGMALAPGVVETIVAIATKEVEGVASIGTSSTGGLRSMFSSKPSAQGVEVEINDDGSLHVTVRVEVYYGYVLPEVAAAVRAAISDAANCQVGLPVGSVDVFIDGIQFAD